MDESLLPKLKRCTREVVNKASKPGGLLDKGEFTMAVARGLITREMGLKEGDLDGKEWKKVVKEEVTAALEEPEPPKSNSKPESKPKVETKAKPESKLATKPESKAKAKPESSPKQKVTEKKSQESSSQTKVDAGEESDMSSVYDAPPKRKKSESSKGEEKEKKEKRPKKDVDEGLSPDEAKIAELKRIVVACGVRKQWSKEFADCPSPSSQIRHLQSILTDLGMKGTPTIGKAKSLKEKRELAAELDDVQEFEAKRGVSDPPEERASRSKDTGRRPSAGTSIGDNDEDEDEEEEQTGPKPKSALASVLDFLGDQSDSD